MLRSFNRFTDALVHGACKNRPKAWRGLLFGITLFHAVIQVRPSAPPRAAVLSGAVLVRGPRWSPTGTPDKGCRRGSPPNVSPGAPS